MKLLCRTIAALFTSLAFSMAFASTSIKSDSFEIYETHVLGNSLPDLIFVPKERWVLIGVTNIVPIKVKDSESFVMENLGNGNYRIVSYDTTNFSTVGVPKISTFDVLYGDVNGDSSVDIILTPNDNIDDLIVVWGEANANAPQTLYSEGTIEGVHDLATANISITDLNNDGVVELQLSDGTGNTYTANYVNGFSAIVTERSGVLVGQTDFTYSVTQGGAAAVSIPITVPKGSAGHTPSLSLTYNSHSGNGLLGVGGSLSAFDTISRCKPRKPQSHEIKWSNQDHYCVNGSFLKETKSISSTEKYFKTEVDNGSLYIAKDINTSGPTYWEVHHADGSIALYGDSTNRLTKHYNSQNSHVLSWARSSVQNKFDAKYEYTYRKFGIGEYLLSTISYADVEVSFGYKERSDQRTAWNAGSKRESTVLLSQIRSEKGNDTFREFAIKYKADSFSELPIIDYVQECVNASACLPKVEFSWADREISGLLQDDALLSASANQISGLLDQVTTGDFDGDGKTDFASFSISNRKLKVNYSGPKEDITQDLDVRGSTYPNYNNKSPSFSANNLSTPQTSSARVRWTNSSGIQAVDLNSDGITDLELTSSFAYSTGSQTKRKTTFYYQPGKKLESYQDTSSDWAWDTTYAYTESTKDEKNDQGYSCSYTPTPVYEYGVKTGELDKWTCKKWTEYETTVTKYRYTSTGAPNVTKPYSSSSIKSGCGVAVEDGDKYCEYTEYNKEYGWTVDSINWSNLVHCRSENERVMLGVSGIISSTYYDNVSSFEKTSYGSELGAFAADRHVNAWCPSSRHDSSVKFRGDITYFADVNGDGREIKFVQNATDLRVAGTTSAIASAGEKDQFYFVDVNQDGLADIIQRKGTLSVRISKGSNQFEGERALGNLNLEDEDNVTFADLNRDGLTDVIYTNGGNVYVRYSQVNDANVSFGTTPEQLSDAQVDYPELYTGDFNGDGLVDLAIRKHTDQSIVSTYFGLGKGTNLEAVTDKIDTAITFVYEQARTGGVYTSDKNLTADEWEYLGQGELVSSIDTPMGTSYYKYAGGVVHRTDAQPNGAHGFTGFELIAHITDRAAVNDEGTVLVTLSKYRTEFPFSGKNSEVRKEILTDSNALNAAEALFFEADAENNLEAYWPDNSPVARKPGAGGSSLPTGPADFGSPSILKTNWIKVTSTSGVHHLFYDEQTLKTFDIDEERTELQFTKRTNRIDESVPHIPRIDQTTYQVWPTEEASSGTPVYKEIEDRVFAFPGLSLTDPSKADLLESKTITYGDGTIKDQLNYQYITLPSGKSAVLYALRNQLASNPRITKFEYDAFGNIEKTTAVKQGQTREFDRIVKSTFDSYGINLLQTEDNYGVTSIFTDHDMYGNPQTIEGADTLRSQVNYNALGSPVVTTSKLGVQTKSVSAWCDGSIECPTNGVYYKVTATDAGGEAYSYFDKNGNEVVSARAAFNSADYHFTLQKYDDFGRLVKKSTPMRKTGLGSWPDIDGPINASVYEYDQLNRLTKQTNANGLEVTNAYENTSVTFEVNSQVANRKVTTTILENGVSKESKINYFNANNQLVATEDQAGSFLWYSYDEKGRKTHTYYNKTTYLTPIADEYHSLVTEYDEFDNVSKVIDPNAGTVERWYNDFGEIRREKNAIGYSTYTYYDLTGQVERINYANNQTTCYDIERNSGTVYSRRSNGYSTVTSNVDNCETLFAMNPQYEETYQYEPDFGQLKTKQIMAYVYGSMKVQTEVYDFDEFRRVNEISLSMSGLPTFSQTKKFDTVTGQVAEINANLDGEKWTWLVEETDILGNVTVAKTVDNNSKIVYQQARYNNLTGALEHGSLTSDQNGETAFSAQTAWNYQFNERGYLTNRWTGKLGTLNEDSLNKYEYKYEDALGNRITSYSQSDKDGFIDHGQFNYDILGNLRFRSEGASLQHFYYSEEAPHQLDKIHFGGATQSFAYNDAGQLTSDVTSKGTALDSVTNTFDRNGKHTRSYTREPGSWGRYYDVNQYYTYNGHALIGSKLDKQGASGEREYYINTYLSSFLEYRQLIGRNQYILKALPNVNIVYDTVDGVHTEQFLKDHLGTTVAFIEDKTSEAGDYNAYDYEFTPFGHKVDRAGDTEASTLNLFTEHEVSEHFEYINMQGRTYSSQTGHFLSPDPVVKDPTNLQHYNRYSYVANNPMSFNDPTGFVMDSGETDKLYSTAEMHAFNEGAHREPPNFTGTSGIDINYGGQSVLEHAKSKNAQFIVDWGSSGGDLQLNVGGALYIINAIVFPGSVIDLTPGKIFNLGAGVVVAKLGDDVVALVNKHVSDTDVASEIAALSRFSDNAANRTYRDLNLNITERGLLDQERSLAEAANWARPDGSTWWPPYDGAIPGTQRTISLSPAGADEPLVLIDRYGKTSGSYVSPAGVPLNARALSGAPTAPPNIYSVDNVINDVEAANAAGWFNQPGTGLQYKLPESVRDLLLDQKLGKQ